MKPRRFFSWACGFEFGLLVGALVLAQFTGQAVLADLHWDTRDAALGALATGPMLGLLWWTLSSSWAGMVRVREILERLIPWALGACSIWELALLSVIAGFSEEVLFRAVIQGGLMHAWGTGGAIAAASLLFGCAHLITLTYGLLAALVGAFLGALWISTGNLLVPILAHACYDFAALLYLLRFHRPSAPCPVPGTSFKD